MIEETWTLAFYCTDRGGHPKDLVQEIEARGHVSDLTPAVFFPMVVPGTSYAPGPCTYEMAPGGPTCGRDPMRRAAFWHKLAQAAITEMHGGTRRVECDISKLD